MSVTAEKWLPIHEVAPEHAVAYLLQKKREGYALVGLEQAQRSVSLEQARLPRKCIVVLGAEKEGMPVDVLPELDVVVEIPQAGIIRSLNVHVSGSLLLWEYIKQRRMEQ